MLTEAGTFFFLAMAVAISIFLLQTRISARLRDFAESRTRFKGMQVVLYAIPYFAIAALIGFPLEFYQSFVREHQYGMATQTFGPWFADEMKALIIALIFGSFALVILYAVFRRAPRARLRLRGGAARARKAMSAKPAAESAKPAETLWGR